MCREVLSEQLKNECAIEVCFFTECCFGVEGPLVGKTGSESYKLVANFVARFSGKSMTDVPPWR